MTQLCFLEDMALMCALGEDNAQVSKGLFAKKSLGLEISRGVTKGLMSHRKTVVYPLPNLLPDMPEPFAHYGSRTNRVVKVLLDRLKPRLETLLQQKGDGRVGCVIGSSTSGMAEAQIAYEVYKKTRTWPKTYHYVQQEPGSPGMFAKAYLDLKGPVYTLSTACSGGGKALCSGYRLLKGGLCDVVIAGGVDTLCSLTENGFDALELVSPVGCLPMSANRRGISLGEGGALFLMSLAEEGSQEGVILKGFGESSDGYHATSPHPEGVGARMCMEQALACAQLAPDDLAYVNLHGTGTLLNDEVESKIMAALFNSRVPCGSSKGLIGHTLAASGALGAAVLWMFLKQGQQGQNTLPYHYWDGVFDRGLPVLPLVTPGMTGGNFSNTVSCMANSFAFGGSNVSLILQTHQRGNL